MLDDSRGIAPADDHLPWHARATAAPPVRKFAVQSSLASQHSPYDSRAPPGAYWTGCPLRGPVRSTVDLVELMLYRAVGPTTRDSPVGYPAMTLPNRPRDLVELRERVASGELRESRVLEFKRQFPGNNKALAKAIAGLAADGGVLVIGVAETESGLEVTPIDCEGVRERVENIARDNPQPPVRITSYILESDTPGLGVLWAEIPASPELAHEVDGTYYARDDTQTRPMRDPEVADRLALRRDRPRLILEALREALEREEPPAPSLHGRTCVVARPIDASGDEFFQATRSHDAWDDFAYSLLPPGGSLPPVPHRYWGQISHRFADYVGHFRSPNLLPSYRDIELQENGAFRHLSYCLDWYEPNVGGVFLPSATHACREAISLIVAVQERTGQRRMWDLALSISDVSGRRARTQGIDPRLTPHQLPIPRDQYSAHLLGMSTARIANDPRSLVEALTGRFIAESGFEFESVWPCEASA
ncbi:MAG: ATP-binding protein [Gammaproteobacteria bacterium]|nr:ATP-binding protein [Gammaproteobacteria bacterium]